MRGCWRRRRVWARLSYQPLLEATMKAWVVTWDWMGDHAAVEDPVVEVLSARTSAEKVRRYVELRYIEKTASLREKLSYARYNQPQKPPYPAVLERVGGVHWLGRITCGHNPWLLARLVDDLRVEVGEDGEDVLRWTERPPPRPARDPL